MSPIFLSIYMHAYDKTFIIQTRTKYSILKIMTTFETSPLLPKYLREDGISEECKNLISILPKEKGWIGSYIYNYQGVWMIPIVIQEVKTQPKLHLKRLAEFLECPFSIEEENHGVVDQIVRMCSFENLSNLEVNKNGKSSASEMEYKVFFRKGEVGDWTNYFTTEMTEKLNHIIEQKFEGSGLRFLYI
ncbi:cytosolic sulfotransferase 9 isoform X1 [Capsicum annuum]|uniref:cytosolic sulfotransferase 9 isoform X1 n=1 Tax=Capsicum annuum TaxID=4072 RepID=UPI001FB0AB28|nr:cytosolic sulfotransferase 9 isoform X1 [Capsicum annuum]